MAMCACCTQGARGQPCQRYSQNNIKTINLAVSFKAGGQAGGQLPTLPPVEGVHVANHNSIFK